MEWFFPETVQEALDLLFMGYTLHGGGTGILLAKRASKGFIHLGRIPELKRIELSGEVIHIGALATYFETASFLKKLSDNHVLGIALSMAATNALRNRITIGGSLGFLPIWSDLMGPLVALDAKVLLRGEHEGMFHAIDFVKRTDLRRNSIVTSVIIRRERIDGLYFRMGRTSVDFADLTITIVGKENPSIAISGTRTKVERLFALEERIRSTGLDQIEKKINETWNLTFSHGRMGSAGFREHLAKVYLARLLKSIGGRSGDQTKGEW